MAEKSAFDKIHVDERDKADLGGVLEQLNLPPAAVEFVRTHQKTIFLILAVIATVVVVWALYDSYADKRLARAGSALAAAQELTGEEKVAALQEVAAEYEGTRPALWSRVELAHHAAGNEEYELAVERYRTLGEDVRESNSLFPLIVFGIAQSEEALGNLAEALAEYERLKNIYGYEKIGYSGVARIYEIQGKKQEAINQYEQYLGTLGDDPSAGGERAYISEKLTRLKASL